MDKRLHIICLDIPFPPNYGGAIDQYYKIKALHDLGCHITLHCFQYGDRIPSAELEQLCTNVFYYPRKQGIRGLHHSLPYLVSSRRHPDLIRNLCLDDAPILFEGVHTTALLHDPKLQDRMKLLRVHNVEQDYYRALGTQSKELKKQLYYFFEAGRLKVYENQLQPVGHFLCISQTELDFFSRLYPTRHHELVTAFHAHSEVSAQPGRGDYCLYHGNLDVEENRQAVNFLAREVFQELNIPLLIAGRNTKGFHLSDSSGTIRLHSNPKAEELQTLVKNAQVHVLPSFQNTGLKLKLLNALYEGRFCLANAAMMAGSGLEKLVTRAETATEFREEIQSLMTQTFSNEHLWLRKEALEPFSNTAQALKIIQLLS